MDIKNEIEELELSNDFGEQIIKNAIHEQEQIVKKIYLLKVLSLAKQVDDLTKTDLFSENGFEFIQITYEYDDQNFKLEFYLVDKDEEIVASSYDADDQVEVLSDIFGSIYPLELDLVSHQLKGNTINIPLKPGIKNTIIQLLLNPELKNLYDYNKMQSDLPENSEKNSKRMKM